MTKEELALFESILVELTEIKSILVEISHNTQSYT